MKVILDSNIVIAAFATQGLCHSLFEVCLDKHQLFLSKELLEEIRENLRRKIKLPAKTMWEIDTLLEEEIPLIDPTPVVVPELRDKDDIKVLGLATASNSDVIVTGDKDLLVLKKFRSIPILSPRGFWSYLERQSSKK